VRHLEAVSNIPAGDKEVLREARAAIVSLLPEATVCLYGSGARGTREPDSDLDLLILTAHPVPSSVRQQVEAALYEIELARRVVISLLWYVRDEWDAAQTWAMPFRRQVEADAVLV
jgi:predicted nucleotidyltransferase